MTAKLAYEIIMTLSETEKDILFNMLEPEMKPLDIKKLVQKKPKNNIEMQLKLIETIFSKHKKK